MFVCLRLGSPEADPELKVCVQVLGRVPRKNQWGYEKVAWGQEGSIKQSPMETLAQSLRGNSTNSVGLTSELS